MGANAAPSCGKRVSLVLRTSVGILIFHDVEVLDFAAPFEVFSRARLTPGVESRRSDESAPFAVFTVGRGPQPVVATGGLKVEPHFAFDSCPPVDVLVVPGGFGTRPLLEDARVLGWIRQTAQSASLTTSVCTGALLLARAGLLHGKRATTHWGAFDLLASIDPSVTVDRDVRVVDDGVITSAGVSAGMDMAFHVVAKVCGEAVAAETARYVEYPWTARLPVGPA
jgi:transcriptional regulator GlxA family with amidase domain